jgi:uncharacterized membrane protein
MFRLALLCCVLLSISNASAQNRDTELGELVESELASHEMDVRLGEARVLTRPIPIRFGYSMSYVPLDAAFAINNAGAIVGRVGGNAAMYRNGVVTVLPGKAGYTNLVAIDIASNGYIVGSGLNAGATRPLFWASPNAAPLDMSALGMVTMPRSINSQGVVVGFYLPSEAALPQAFRWSMTTGMRSITPDGASTAQAFDISETGYIAGHAQYPGLGQQVVRWHPDASPSRVTGPGFAERALDSGSVFGAGTGGSTLWNLINTATLIGPKPSTHVVKQRSSASRWVGFTVGEPPLPRAWTSFENGAATYLPVPAGASAFATDVNGCGTILGSVSLPDGTTRPVVWSKVFCDVLPPIVAQ